MSARPNPIRTVERHTAGAFADRFGMTPAALAHAPGRLNLMGDHTDYCGGLALPIAISVGAAAAVALNPAARAAPARAQLLAIDLNESCDAPLDPVALDAELPSLPAWVAYAAGALAESADEPLRQRGVRLAFSSSVPIGSGLSSSAAITLACLLAARSLTDPDAADHLRDPARREALARSAQRIEHRYAGVPCGLLDQRAIVGGLRDAAQRLDFATGTAELVPISARIRFLIIDTGIRRRNADGRYAAIQAAADQAARRLGIEHLALAAPKSLTALPPDILPTARHVVEESARVDDFIAALRAHDPARLGQLADASHASLSGLLGVSTPEIDRMADAARSVPGVLGVRLTGAGLGGCMVALVHQHADNPARDIAGAIRSAGFEGVRVWEETASDGCGVVADLD